MCHPPPQIKVAVIFLCVDLPHRESVGDRIYQKTEEGTKEAGQKKQSEPDTPK